MTRSVHGGAFGLSAHSGWAVLVTVTGPVGDPVLLDRRRIELADRTPAQPYHEAAKLRDVRAAASLIERARADAERRASAAIASAIDAAARHGCGVRAAALLTNKMRSLPGLEQILAAHPLLHAAEGDLFRRALILGCEHGRLRIDLCAAADVYEDAGRLLNASPAALRDRLAVVGRAAGPPWQADHKAAFLAAWRSIAGAHEHGI